MPPHPLHCTANTSLPGCPQAQGSFVGEGFSFPLLLGGPRRLRLVRLRSRSCISASGEAGGVSRWRRNLLFAPVLREAGGRKRGGDDDWRLLLFNFIFLPPSRNLCNVPAAPREAEAAVSHCCRWNVTQSCCSRRQDMTRLPKLGRSPNAAVCPRRRARPREIPPESSASASRRDISPSPWGRAQAGAQNGLFYLFLFIFYLFFFPPQPEKPSPPTLAHPSVGHCGYLPGVLLPHLPGQAL